MIEDNKRLDMYLVEQYPTITRALAQRLVADGKIKVNGVVATKSGHKIRSIDSVDVDYDPDAPIEIPEIDIPVIYEDDDCVVIDKPAGLLSHSKGAFNPEATVATWLAWHMCERINPSQLLSDGTKRERINPSHSDREGIVHRLDRGTSGVMICAKTPEALSFLQKQFAQRRTKKTYIARAEGHIEPQKAIIDLPIERNPKQPQRFRVGKNGKSAETEYKVLKEIEDDSIVELKPRTGRTHQLRVHLKYIKHPIVGDTFYEGRPASRLYLHAHTLELTLPSRERRIFTSAVPNEFYKARGL